MRSFIKLAFLKEQIPDTTTPLYFQHLLKQNKIGQKIFLDVIASLEATGLMIHRDTIANASLIVAPTKILVSINVSLGTFDSLNYSILFYF